MRKLIIFGTDKLANRTLYQLLKIHGEFVAGFTVDNDYLFQTELEDLPAVQLRWVKKYFLQRHILSFCRWDIDE